MTSEGIPNGHAEAQWGAPIAERFPSEPHQLHITSGRAHAARIPRNHAESAHSELSVVLPWRMGFAQFAVSAWRAIARCQNSPYAGMYGF